MISEELKVQIIHLRASGYSHEKIAKRLGISKQTVINISNDYTEEINHQKDLIRAESLKAFSASRIKAIESTSELLNNLCTEITHRSFEDVKTENLINLFLKTVSAIGDVYDKNNDNKEISKLIIQF